ncbi:MAG TPA: carboxylating nicotinate-nucleotide diphosphorylase [Syntrophales bacterium]|nr:carboxylating nicotinate-nucleotide diphosphorylase [Syntrophales bacterium]
MIEKYIIHRLIQSALEEDIGTGDITTTSVLAGEEMGKAKAFAKANIVVAGIDVFREVFIFLDKSIQFSSHCEDGRAVKKGGILAEISGNLGSILTAERVALNFFQRMCGIATLTRQYVDEVKGTPAKILDTRKTVPGLRCLDKYAVRIGGGTNHRYGLYDGVLIKDNHIAAAGSISKALSRVRARIPHTLKVEVEVKNLQEVEEALVAGADVIMLDNMTDEDMKKAVAIVNRKVPLEASGNVTLANVRKIAETGVDFISVGALTHSAPASDISLKIE